MGGSGYKCCLACKKESSMIARGREEVISSSKFPIQICMWEGLLQDPHEVPLNALFFQSGFINMLREVRGIVK